MKNQFAFKLFGSTALLATLILTSMGAAQASTNPSNEETVQAQTETISEKNVRTGLRGSYIGGGGGYGSRLNDDVNNNNFVGNAQGRLTMPRDSARNIPFSLRGSLGFDGNNVVAVPSVTYDLAINDRANIYAGLGYSIVGGDNEMTSLGDKDSLVINGGFESVIQDNFIGYTDLKLGTDSYQDDRGSALSIQAGLGYRF